MIYNINRKCCQSNSVSETATRALEEPVAVEEPLKVEEQAEDAATEASVEDKVEAEAEITDAEAEEQAAASGYKCCGIFWREIDRDQ